MRTFLCLVFVLFLSCSNGTEITQNSYKYQLLNDTAEDISISYFNEDKLEFKLIASEMSQGSNENIFQYGIEVYVFNVKLDTILTIKSDYAFQNKIDDVVLWMTFFWKAHSSDWNVDGGHPGTKGHQAIKEVILQNIKEKYG